MPCGLHDVGLLYGIHGLPDAVQWCFKYSLTLTVIGLLGILIWQELRKGQRQ